MNSNIRPKRGLRSFYPTDKGPIDLYQLGHDGRIEYLQAQIAVDHLTKGINTTEEWKKWAKERGSPTDEPGLIISKRLGGSGIDSINLFPKSPLLDNTSWTKDEEKAYKEAAEMKKWKKMKFFAKLEYPEDDSLRPSEIEYQYDLPSGNKLYGKVSNVAETTSSTPTTTTTTEEKVVVAPGGEVEEEEGSEFEYEYEEEEEEEAPPPQPLPPPPPPSKKKETTIPVDTPLKPEVPSHPIEPKPEPAPKKRSPSPPVNNVVLPPPIVKIEPKLPVPSTPTKLVSVPDEPLKPPPTPMAVPAPSKDDENRIKPNSYRIFARSDFMEILPIVGSCKLLVDTVKAVYNKDTQRSLWKGAQTGISLFADFHLIRAFTRHGQILAKPITEDKLMSFATKAEPHIIIFVACKAGNEILSVVRRIFSKKETT